MERDNVTQKRTSGDWISVGVFAVAMLFLLAVLIVPKFAGPILVLFVIFLVVLVFFAVTFILMSGPAQKAKMPLKQTFEAPWKTSVISHDVNLLGRAKRSSLCPHSRED